MVELVQCRKIDKEQMKKNVEDLRKKHKMRRKQKLQQNVYTRNFQESVKKGQTLLEQSQEKSRGQVFQTTFKKESRIDLEMKAAGLVQASPYSNDNGVHFRDETCDKHVGPTFITHFARSNNQNLRLGCAQDQEGFHSGPVIKTITTHDWNPQKEGKKDFILQVPKTVGKTANFNLKAQATLNQAGIWDGGKTIAEHNFRDEATNKKFETFFTPTGKGAMCVDMGSRQMPHRLS